MTYDEAVAWVDAHAWRGVRPGLERMHGVLELLDDPHLTYPTIHVAGTNGKTTVARLVTAIVVGHGLSAGTFTSPHLHRLEERFPVNLIVPSAGDLVDVVTEVRPIVDLYEVREGEGPTYFELTAILAFARFAAMAVDAAVVEVGLGGRLDATNVVRPDVAVVTSIGLDHTEILGSEVAQIAREKLGILKSGTAALVTGELPPEAAAEATAAAEAAGVPHVAVGRDVRIEDARIAVGGWMVDIDGLHDRYEDVFLPLHGRHQAGNLAVAVATSEAFLGRALSVDDLRAAIGAVSSPGRLEVIGQHPLVVVDGAHNPDGMAVAVAAVAEEFIVGRWVVVLGAMADKDLDGMVGHLVGFADEVVTTAVDNQRAASPQLLARVVAAQLADVPVHTEADPAAALELASALAGPDGGVLVVGSLYLVGALTGPPAAPGPGPA